MWLMLLSSSPLTAPGLEGFKVFGALAVIEALLLMSLAASPM